MTNIDVIKSLDAREYNVAMCELNLKRGLIGNVEFLDWLQSEIDNDFWFNTMKILRLNLEDYIE